MVEILDVFNDNMHKIGEEVRDEIHKKGYWHQTFHCWLVAKIDDEEYLVFQKRGSHKKICPDKLDVSVAGHLLKGESKEDGVRELYEEIGINVEYSELKYLGIRCSVADLGKVIEREFAHVHLYNCNLRPEEYDLEIDELAGVVFLKISEGLKLFSDETDKVRVWGIEVNDAGEMKDLDYYVKTKDFINTLDNYYLKVLIMAQRFFEGHKYISI